MASIKIPTPLRQYTGNNADVAISGATVGEAQATALDPVEPTHERGFGECTHGAEPRVARPPIGRGDEHGCHGGEQSGRERAHAAQALRGALIRG